LYSKRRAELAGKIIKKRMRQESWARIYGLLAYKQKRDKISELEIKQIQEELLRHGIYSKAETTKKKFHIRIISSDTVPNKNQIFIPIALFLITIFTTAITGAHLVSRDPFSSWEQFSKGFYYAFALLSILLSHEMAHYSLARKYKVNVTLPYFIPFYFPLIFSFGTFGAFLRLKSPIPNKVALFDIGISGPIAGFILSVVFLIIGFQSVPNEPDMWRYIETIRPLAENSDGALTFGGNLLFDFFMKMMGKEYLPMHLIQHFPFIIAGWLGLLITTLNLMPIGQLDGGHITHALFGKNSARLAVFGFALLIILNVVLISAYNSFVYVLWPFLILFFLKFRHPPTVDEHIEIGVGRRILGYSAYVIFILCFSPMPIFLQ